MLHPFVACQNDLAVRRDGIEGCQKTHCCACAVDVGFGSCRIGEGRGQNIGVVTVGAMKERVGLPAQVIDYHCAV